MSGQKLTPKIPNAQARTSVPTFIRESPPSPPPPPTIHSIPAPCLDICRHHQYYIFGQGKMNEDQGKIRELYLVN